MSSSPKRPPFADLTDIGFYFGYESFDDGVLPQHQEFVFDNPTDTCQRVTNYAGEINFYLDAGDDPKPASFQYIVLGTFNGPGGVPTLGIKPVAAAHTFRSAVAFATLTREQYGDNVVWADVESVSANLMEVFLEDPRRPILVVVLSGMLNPKNKQLKSISYHVSVLERFNDNPPAPAPLRLGFEWDGIFDIGALVKPGFPQD
jgi:hypothetical protein